MLVHMQFELKHFSVGFYLIITEKKHKHPGMFGSPSRAEHFAATAQSHLQSNEGNMSVCDQGKLTFVSY